jgi:hypothetical protein
VTDPGDAFAWLQGERTRIRDGATLKKRLMPRFATYAASVFERKVDSGEIKSEASREKWTYTLTKLISGAKGVPGFGPFFIDQIRYSDVVEWRSGIGRLVTTNVYKPNYVNDWLAIMRVIMKSAVAEFELDRDPMLNIANIDKALHRTYTREEPNALVPEELKRFLSWARLRFPQHFAYVLLGLGLGQRECTLRPLRRSGPTPDFLPKEGLLLIRRSHTRNEVIMDMTKTKRDQTVRLPPSLVRVLQWHINTQMVTDAMISSDLLFPGEDGLPRTSRYLRRFFEAAEVELTLSKHVTGRALRRTFQDLTREAEVDAVVAKAISGHATETMRVHYSSASDAEVQAGINKVISMAGFRETRSRSSGGGGKKGKA